MVPLAGTQYRECHTYSSAGTYSVTITATGPGGTDDATHSVRVSANTTQLEAGLRAVKGPAGSEQTMTFENITIGEADTFVWNFGDGTVIQNGGGSVTHKYASPGTYSVTITASNGPTSDSATHSVRVDPNT